ncbi:S23 ribosomal [Winogradskyella psychrotolerans RS-3]|uniref:S23 ribosomal n=1 Tax=Winogradskyella psychrotolerans RS-3 TaxID=641526 RepID=S7VXA3_9FLAO|nr:S23 ribosomal [Winogradskyella psychrotolerans RS-3]
MTPQLGRFSVSIPSNIADGSSRTNKSFSYFIDIELGSSFELETQLIIVFKRNYITQLQLTKIEEKLEEFQKMTMGFQNEL